MANENVSCCPGTRYVGDTSRSLARQGAGDRLLIVCMVESVPWFSPADPRAHQQIDSLLGLALFFALCIDADARRDAGFAYVRSLDVSAADTRHRRLVEPEFPQRRRARRQPRWKLRRLADVLEDALARQLVQHEGDEAHRLTALRASQREAFVDPVRDVKGVVIEEAVAVQPTQAAVAHLGLNRGEVPRFQVERGVEHGIAIIAGAAVGGTIARPSGTCLPA